MADTAEAALRPPARRLGPIAWMRRNLFGSPVDAAITLLILYGLWLLLAPLIDWALLDAVWAGDGREACHDEGACWLFIGARIEQFIYGFYPVAERWRVNLAFGLVLLAALPLAVPRLPRRGRITAIALPVSLVVGGLLLTGGVAGLVPIPTARWGGLMLTLVVSIVGIAASFPLGVLLALARRSEMPVIRMLAIGFIELWRGVPLVTVLFMSSVMLPLFLPEGVNFNKLLRALIGIALFAAAYMAEVVRGGLQAIPRGQYEAAAALGLGYWRMMGLIILPQALRHVIPGIVNSFIALFKDTTLVLIIGLFDFLGIIQAALTDPQWLGLALEGYVFAAAVYWVFCFAMSRASARIEASGGGARGSSAW